MNKRTFLTTAALLIGMVMFQAVLAENSTQIPGYTIHHNALTTDFLTPQVAKAYKLQRSKNRGMLNVSVIKDVPGTTGKAVTAKVRVKATDLLGKTQVIPMREIREGDAIYYIGEFPVANGTKLYFDIEVTPEGADRSYTATLTQEFFVD